MLTIKIASTLKLKLPTDPNINANDQETNEITPKMIRLFFEVN